MADAPACWGCECDVARVGTEHQENTGYKNADGSAIIYCYPCSAPRCPSCKHWLPRHLMGCPEEPRMEFPR